MSTNRHKRISTTGGAAAARVWSCAKVSRRGTPVAAMAGTCLTAAAAYLLGGEPGLQGAKSINDPRFTDQNNQT